MVNYQNLLMAMKKTYLTYASRAVTIGLCLLLWTSEGQAQEGDIAGAEALFQEGRRLMDEGNSKAACPKLEESQRLDPGTGTLWHLARCYQDTGRLASAWATFHLVAQEAKRLGETAKVKAALARAKKLDPKLHKLRIEVPDESRLSGLTISRGGTDVGPGAWGAGVPVDEGELVIEASAPGYKTWKKVIQVEGGSLEHSVTIPKLKEEAKKKVVAPKKKTKKRKSSERWYHDKIGWAVFATGIITLGGGGYTYQRARQLEDDANAAGDLGERDRLFDESQSSELTSGVLLATGAAITVTGMVLLALTPSNSDTEEVSYDFTPSFTFDTQSAFLGLSKNF